MIIFNQPDSGGSISTNSNSILEVGMAFDDFDQEYFLDQVTFRLHRTGSPTGTITANLYEVSAEVAPLAGNIQHSDVGSLITSSTPVDISSISTSFSSPEDVTFVFDGLTQLDPNKSYLMAMDFTGITYSGGDISYHTENTVNLDANLCYMSRAVGSSSEWIEGDLGFGFDQMYFVLEGSLPPSNVKVWNGTAWDSYSGPIMGVVLPAVLPFLIRGRAGAKVWDGSEWKDAYVHITE